MKDRFFPISEKFFENTAIPHIYSHHQTKR